MRRVTSDDAINATFNYLEDDEQVLCFIDSRMRVQEKARKCAKLLEEQGWKADKELGVPDTESGVGESLNELVKYGVAFHMAGLSLELVILYTFQNNFGNIYHIVGFIIAVFMFGLPLGAAASNRLITRKKLNHDTRIIKWIICIQLLVAGISLLLPRLTKLFLNAAFLNQLIIFIETMMIGFAIGLIFPLSIHVYMGKTHQKTGKTAGTVDAFDHLGAAVGAFFIGTLFLPVIGLQKVCILVALFPFITSALLFTDILRMRIKR